MIDCRRDVELPFICDDDKDAVAKLSSLVLGVVGFEIPGVGIRNNSCGTHDSAHIRHRELVTDAISLAGNELSVGSDFTPMYRLAFGSGTRLHSDALPQGPVNERGCIVLRLHTADEINGAHVTLANAAPGFNSGIGDREVFPYHNRPDYQAYLRGYDGQNGLWAQMMFDPIYEGSYNPLANEGNIYYFEQEPLYSVLFRSATSFGPATVHGFDAMDKSKERYGYNSDLLLASQTL